MLAPERGASGSRAFHASRRSQRTGRLVPYAWPSQKAMRAVREKIRQQTERTRLRVELGELVGALNRNAPGGVWGVGATERPDVLLPNRAAGVAAVHAVR